MSSLYVVATPIGNLEDVSLRALRVLKEVQLIVAEDTRVARKLLNHFAINNRLLSYNEHNRDARIPEVLQALANGDVALVSDAGTPAISDPGIELVAAARVAGFNVVAVPGPSSPVAALSIAGLPTLPFTFVGFLPRRTAELRRAIEQLLARSETTVALESPQRLHKTLAVLQNILPERRLAVCRELTKMHEEVFVGTAGEALAHFDQPRGEIVLVIEGTAVVKDVSGTHDEAEVEPEVAQMKRLGLSRSQATAILTSRYGLSRRQSYALWLKAGDT